MAESGSTYQYLRYGYSAPVAEAVKAAVVNKRGIRQLPRRLYQYPLRPYDIRRNWNDYPNPSEMYNQDFEIPVEDTDSLPGVSASSVQSRYVARLVTSPFANEGLCFAAQSTIDGAGFGLFLRSRKTSIRKGINFLAFPCFLDQNTHAQAC